LRQTKPHGAVQRLVKQHMEMMHSGARQAIFQLVSVEQLKVLAVELDQRDFT
jgi:hypothetical protein